jgi:hypothetical protein
MRTIEKVLAAFIANGSVSQDGDRPFRLSDKVNPMFKPNISSSKLFLSIALLANGTDAGRPCRISGHGHQWFHFGQSVSPQPQTSDAPAELHCNLTCSGWLDSFSESRRIIWGVSCKLHYVLVGVLVGVLGVFLYLGIATTN